MNTLPKYSEQYDKIINAYFKDEIQPLEAKFCFCGTLADNSDEWCNIRYSRRCNYFMFYTGNEYVMMERALLDTLQKGINGEVVSYEELNGYEERLFNGMAAALEVLKQIHIKRGEIIDEAPQFKKRELQTL